ncbi:MAG: hypothetical protein P8174_08380, partial [Gemmatimonadota bacterium]
ARTPDEDPHIVVLPFEHDGPEQDRYFTEGVADELTNGLAGVPGIAVTARTSAVQLGGSDLTLAEIGEQLGVDHVVRGSVRWPHATGPARIRMNATLVRVADGRQLWGRSYDVAPDDGFDAQADAVEAITGALGLEPRATAVRPRSVAREREARELFLKAFQHAKKRSEKSLRTAAELYQQAIILQPDFARAYAGLAQVYAVFPGFTGAQPREWYLKARTAAESALDLDPDLPEAHAALAFPLLHLWDLAGAERHLDRCVELAPSYAPAWVRLGYLYCATARPRQAREQRRGRARLAMPRSAPWHWTLCRWPRTSTRATSSGSSGTATRRSASSVASRSSIRRSSWPRPSWASTATSEATWRARVGSCRGWSSWGLSGGPSSQRFTGPAKPSRHWTA